MGKKKIMIIGAGSGQVPIIELCKKKGLETWVVSPLGSYPGIELADKHINEDIFNTAKLIEIGRKENINYVLSDQSDYAVPIVAKIANELSLPGNDPEIAQTYSFKSKFREFCFNNNIPCPKAVSIRPDYNQDVIKSLKFPLVIKPSDSQGSRGIIMVTDINNMKVAIDSAFKYSKNDTVVVEEYFKGKEIVCEGFVLDGKYYNIAFGDREYFKIPNKFIPSKTIFPSFIDENVKKKIIINEEKITSLLKPDFGIIHSEYIINDKGDFIIVESALRGGGVYIASHLIPFTTGIDLTEVLFYAMIGDKTKVKNLVTQKKPSSTAEYLCFYLNQGTVTKKNIDVLSKIEDLKMAEIDNINVGDVVGPFEHKGQRKGPIIMHSKNFQSLKDEENLLKSQLIIEVDGKKGINWE